MLFSSILIFCLFPSHAKNVKDRPLKQVLNEIEKSYQIYFSYNPEEIKSTKVDYDDSEKDVAKLLSDILNETDLIFEKVDDKFYVVKRADSQYINLLILDAESNEPLPFATARLKGTQMGQIADDKGALRLVITKPQNKVLEISFLGFQTFELSLSSISSKDQFPIVLQPEPMDLNDFEVREYINVGIASDPKANSFRIIPQEMEILPGLSERDVLLSAQIISGLSSTDESANSINIRGGARDNVLLYWNNVPIYHTAHYFGNISSFIPSSIGTLDIYKNFIPVRYGGASSGLISIDSRNDINGETKVEASLNMTHADLYVKLPFQQDYGSFMFALRRSYNDLFTTPTFNSYTRKLFESRVVESAPNGRVLDDYDEEQAFSNDLSFSDVNFQWTYKPTDRLDLDFSFLRNRSSFSYIEDEIENFENIDLSHDVTGIGTNATLGYRVNDNHSMSASISFSDYDMSYSFVNRRNEFNEDDDDSLGRFNTLRNFEIRLASNHQLNSESRLELGYQLNSVLIENTISEDRFIEEDDVEVIDTKGGVHALFADYNYQPNNQFELVASARLTRIGSLGDTYFSPQLKLNYEATEGLILKSSFGIYHQYLSAITETEFTLSNAIEQYWVFAGEVEEGIEIPVIINRQTSLGAIYNVKSWLIDFDFYVKDVEGILARNLGFNLRPENDFELGTERITGLDLTIRKRWKQMRLWASYNFQDSKVELPTVFNFDFPSNLNLRHQFRISGTYNVKNWEFSLGYIYKSGLPFTSADRIRIQRNPRDRDDDDDDDDDDFDPDQEFARIEFQEPNGARLPLYHRVDLSVWYKFGSDENKVKGEIGLSLMNLFNRRNIFNRSYLLGFDDRDRPQLFERTKYFLEFTPNLSIRVWL